MGNSLFDQLKKSGLVDEKKAKLAKQEKHKQIKQQKGVQGKPVSDVKQRALAAQAEKVAKDRELNQQRKQAAEHKAIAAQIKQLVEMNRIDTNDADSSFNFTDGSSVQRVYVTDVLRTQLANGHLAIVKLEGQYALVPMRVAEKIRLRDPSYLVLCNAPSSPGGDADDPYVDFQVPDDLMW